MSNRLFRHGYSSPDSFSGIEDGDILAGVEKPARYIGTEVNHVKKDLREVKLHVALAFPDVYEIGMSHLGLKILYSVVNSRPEFYAERVFAPWPDMEASLRREGRPLKTLETGTPLDALDFVGFSLQYELCATNVLQMLDLGMIPIAARNRNAGHPFIVGGGPGALNPAPLSRFFDAFVIGDGEEAILELAAAHVRWKETRGSRNELLDEWKRIPGVYVPSRHRKGESIRRRIVADLEGAPFPHRPVVPFCETVHDRIGLEIARGCSRGCRFCQAGMMYRPVRERRPQTIIDLAHSNVSATGWEEIALLSLSAGDHSCINDVIKGITRDFACEKVALSLPSLRTDSLDPSMVEQIRKVRKTGFTLAPEAGTERLRRIINKGNSEDDLERAVTTAFDGGWRAVKLYFMIGLPFETDEDLDGIVRLVLKASKWAKGGRITASVSTFVPKSHTPFQWCEQISVEETMRRRHYIRRYFQKGRTRVKFHNPRVSFLEGVIARGDERLGAVIESAYGKGARFEGWDERLNFDVWMDAFTENGIDPEDYLKSRSIEEELPWDFVDGRVSKDFLSREWAKAEAGETTPDCRNSDCSGCGVCDFEQVLPRPASHTDADPDLSHGILPPDGHPTIRRLRLQYAKLGAMRFLGHHDVTRVFHRALRRMGLKPAYSNGFHPHPKLRFSPPLGLGIESLAEFVDVDLVDCRLIPEEIMAALNSALPPGMQPLAIEERSLNEDPVSGTLRRVTYELSVSDSLSMRDVAEMVRKFESSQTFEITRVHKGKSKTRDLKEWVCRLETHESILRMEFKSDASGSVHPYDAVSAILGIGRDSLKTMRLVKTEVGFKDSLT
ncbi:MAG: TIGR03960 family B12-binding radical SAM protein [Desulfomonilaceae bacterium]|nr:TIGR03960 family B12-binding radical SAM protein [Desulfomonilaceae bacterium]